MYRQFVSYTLQYARIRVVCIVAKKKKVEGTKVVSLCEGQDAKKKEERKREHVRRGRKKTTCLQINSIPSWDMMLLQI